MSTSYQVTDGVAVITMDDGKANAVSSALQTGVNNALDRAEADGLAAHQVIARVQRVRQARGRRLATARGDFLYRVGDVAAEPLAVTEIPEQLLLRLVDDEYDVRHARRHEVVHHELGDRLVVQIDPAHHIFAIVAGSK